MSTMSVDAGRTTTEHRGSGHDMAGAHSSNRIVSVHGDLYCSPQLRSAISKLILFVGVGALIAGTVTLSTKSLSLSAAVSLVAVGAILALGTIYVAGGTRGRECMACSAFVVFLGIPGFCIVAAIAPVVSAIALPIFVGRSIKHAVEHSIQYEKTLTVEKTREKAGRVKGQDYTRWDGKAIERQQRWGEPICEEREYYYHGYTGKTFYHQGSSEDQRTPRAEDCPFTTPEDWAWLDAEYARREIKETLESDLGFMRAFGKALIPVVGVIWVYTTEMDGDSPFFRGMGDHGSS